MQPYYDQAGITSLVERFWIKVDIPLLFGWIIDEDACWLWSGGTSCSGRRCVDYGIIREGRAYGTRRWRAPRLALLLPYAHDLEILHAADTEHRNEEAAHKCDRSLCVNPQHLEWRTHSENISDQIVRRKSSKIFIKSLPVSC